MHSTNTPVTLLEGFRRDGRLDLLKVLQGHFEVPRVLRQAHFSELRIHSCPLAHLLDQTGLIGCRAVRSG